MPAGSREHVGEVRRFAHADRVVSVAFSADGRRILSGGGGRRAANGKHVPGSDFSVRLWDAETGRALHRWDEHTSYVWGVALSPDGRQAITGGEAVRVWATDGTNSRPAVELVARSAPVGEYELVPLLRKRLLFLLLIFAVFYTLIFLCNLCYVPFAQFSRRADPLASLATLVACFGLAAILSSRPGLTLRQLRGVEFLMVALFAARMFLRGYVLFRQDDHMDRVHGWIAADEGENARQMLIGLSHRLTGPSAVWVVAYGVIVPNTWRRCALIVAVFTLAPIGIWLAACIARGLPTDYWLSFPVVIAFLVLIQTAVLSVYGAYRIESSRQEAAEARRLGQYVLREKIGGGGMGEVYRADHLLLRRPCAVKLIRPERAGDPATLQRFELEVQATATLTHPNTVQIFDYGRAEDGTFYYVMEFLPGMTLEELVKEQGPLPSGRIVHFLDQLCGSWQRWSSNASPKPPLTASAMSGVWERRWWSVTSA